MEYARRLEVRLPEAWVILAGLAGLCFSVIAMCLRGGQRRGAPPIAVSMFLAVVGSAFFAGRCLGQSFDEMPLWASTCGLIAGGSQYAAMRFMQACLERGPLSPVWCAASLGFLPAIVYSHGAFAEPIGAAQYVAVVTAVACVVVASTGQKDARPTDRPGDGQTRGVFYLVGLSMVFLLNGVTTMATKDLGLRAFPAGGTYMDRYADVFLLGMYFAMAAGIFLDLLVRRRLRFPVRWTVGLGVLAGAASSFGYWAIAACAARPAAIVFTVSSTVSILGASVASVAAFGERPSPAWFGTVGLAVATVVLANVPAA